MIRKNFDEIIDDISMFVCPRCNGKGTVEDEIYKQLYPCSYCQGYGWVDWIHKARGGRPFFDYGTRGSSIKI